MQSPPTHDPVVHDPTAPDSIAHDPAALHGRVPHDAVPASRGAPATTGRDASTTRCFAPCPRGLEAVLVDELAAIGIDGATETAGGVHFSGTRSDAMRVNLHSRLASRVLVRIAEGRYRSEDDIHRLARAQDWRRWFGPERTLRVDVATGSGRQKSGLKSLEFVTLRIKDGICDRLRDDTGARPSIDTRSPDVRVFGFLDANRCVLYLDTTGEPLFKRGWRTEAGAAPLRENLAAGILRLAGWAPGTPLLDPMCGSGSFVVEAAQTALSIAPGAARSFGFERLADFDRDAWTALKDAARAVSDGAATDDAALAAVAAIRGSDVSGDAVAMTRNNLERAGIPPDVARAVAARQIDARQVRPQADHGIVVANPPYGERIAVRGERAGGDDRRHQADRSTRPRADRESGDDDEAAAFFGEFGNLLKQRFAGWTCHILTADLALQKKLRLAPDRRVVLFNGAIECRLFRFVVVAGSHR